MNNSNKWLMGSVFAGIVLIAVAVFFARRDAEPIVLPIKVVEYSDFQCPACKYYAEGLGVLKSEEYAGKVDFEYRHFPLTTIHEYAYNAAVASEAAREQGKFNEYHDILFANQPRLSDEELIAYASEIGLDVEKFTNAFQNSPEVKARVDKDIADATELGINSTPTFFINGAKYSPSDLETLLERIDKYVEKGSKN